MSRSLQPFLVHAGKTHTADTEPELVRVLQKATTDMYGIAAAGALYPAAPEAIATAALQLLKQPINEPAEQIGIHPAMATEGVQRFSNRLTPSELNRFRYSELPSDRIQLSPRIVFHVLAGNLFVSGLESMLHAALTGACSIVRCSSDDTQFPLLWQQALEAQPALASTIAVGWWPAEWQSATRAAAEASDAVVAFGNDQSITAIRNLTPVNTRFIPHGSKISFAILGEDALNSQTAELLAQDFALYDQQGCLSPRTAFLLTSNLDVARAFADALTKAMHGFELRFPRQPLALADAAALARTRDETILAAALGESATLASAASDPFLVSLRKADGYSPGCLNRNCDLRISTPSMLKKILAPYRGQISTIGVAGTNQELDSLQRDLSIPRICPVGTMQSPPLGWSHDGRLSLADLVQFASREC